MRFYTRMLSAQVLTVMLAVACGGSDSATATRKTDAGTTDGSSGGSSSNGSGGASGSMTNGGSSGSTGNGGSKAGNGGASGSSGGTSGAGGGQATGGRSAGGTAGGTGTGGTGAGGRGTGGAIGDGGTLCQQLGDCCATVQQALRASCNQYATNGTPQQCLALKGFYCGTTDAGAPPPVDAANACSALEACCPLTGAQRANCEQTVALGNPGLCSTIRSVLCP